MARWVRQREIDGTGVPYNNEGIHCVPWLKDHDPNPLPSHQWAKLIQGIAVADLKRNHGLRNRVREHGEHWKKNWRKKK